MPSLLPRWYTKLNTPSTAKVVFLGDSTSADLPSPGMYAELRGPMVTSGGLYGMNTANIIQGGTGGARAYLWAADGAATYTYAMLLADAPHLIVLSFGINDAIDGHSAATITADLTTLCNKIRGDLPLVDFCFGIPVIRSDATFSTATLAAAYAALSFTNSTTVDYQLGLLGGVYPAGSPLMADPWHPSVTGYAVLADYIVSAGIGRYRLAVSRSAVSSRTSISRSALASRVAVA